MIATADPATFSLIQRLADNKYWLGRRYAEWCTAAPTLESAVAAAAMAQDEIGHARSLYPLFRQFVGHDVEPENRESFSALGALDRPFENWVDFVATNFLIDTALTVLLEAGRESTYDDLRTRARRIVGEEHIHWLHGQGWVKRLGRESSGTRMALEEALQRRGTEAIMWFGSDDSNGVRHLLDSGVLGSSAVEMRNDYLKRVDAVLRDASMSTTADWLLRTATRLPWQQWDGERYRLNIG